MSHIKVKLDVQRLEIGMYVVELDRPWLETPFLFQGFEIQRQDEIAQLQRYCKYVYVLMPEPLDTAAGDRAENKGETTRLREFKQRSSATYLVEQELLKINNHPDARSAYADQTTLDEESRLAREIYVEARDLIRAVMEDVRRNAHLDIPGIRSVIAKMTESMIRNPDALVCFAQLKRKDEYTALHSLRVCILALALGRQLSLTEAQLNALGIGALLHDIGKMRVPDEILRKTDTLTAAEFEIIKRHVVWGVELLENAEQVPRPSLEIVRFHHERYDGSGYADGLKGGEIGVFGMIGGIVDHYDAITSDRGYRCGIPSHTALKELYPLRGKLFHPVLVEKFIQCMGIYPIGSVVELNTGEVGVVVSLNRTLRLKPRVALVLNPERRLYPKLPAVNLAVRKTPDGRPCEVERVLDPSACGIDPQQYLPTVAAA